jgi:hypothetical protein
MRRAVRALAASAALAACAAPPEAAVEPELAAYMGELQRQTHKLNLSVDGQNRELAGFYLHEVREVVEQIEERFPRHDGFPVADLVRATLDPQLATLRAAVGDARWHAARSGLGELVAGCNRCHAATGHGFVRIELTNENPFNQSFAPR